MLLIYLMVRIASHAVEEPTGDRCSRVTTLCKNEL